MAIIETQQPDLLKMGSALFGPEHREGVHAYDVAPADQNHGILSDLPDNRVDDLPVREPPEAEVLVFRLRSRGADLYLPANAHPREEERKIL